VFPSTQQPARKSAGAVAPCLTLKENAFNAAKFANKKAIVNERKNISKHDGISVILDGEPYHGQNDRVGAFIECILH
jgi:hypothetical protein